MKKAERFLPKKFLLEFGSKKMNFAHLLEAGMLVCFGFSWPLNVIKAYKARTAKGMSLAFIILIITGYLAGISAKFISGQINYVLAVYLLNLLIVSANVGIYIRNKALDRKRNKAETVQVENIQITEIQLTENNFKDALSKEDAMSVNYSNSFDELINPIRNEGEKQNQVILLGGSFDKKIPVDYLANEFDFNFDLYNKSRSFLKLSDSKTYVKNQIAQLKPEGVLLHLGENDITLFKSNPANFDSLYLNLIEEFKKINKKVRIALISVSNPQKDNNIYEMNKHIKAIADSENCTFVNLENTSLWNPEATKSAVEFAYETGLKVRKPLKNVAEILYSYAYNKLYEPSTKEHLA